MATKRQITGDFGEDAVVKRCRCPRCKKTKSLKRLPVNFKCADVICDFCGYMAQVKTANCKSVVTIPDKILGGAWGVQRDRMDAGIYFPLFLVLVDEATRQFRILYLPADLQSPEMFVVRKPLSDKARRAGWQGYYLDLQNAKHLFTPAAECALTSN